MDLSWDDKNAVLTLLADFGKAPLADTAFKRGAGATAKGIYGVGRRSKVEDQSRSLMDRWIMDYGFTQIASLYTSLEFRYHV